MFNKLIDYCKGQYKDIKSEPKNIIKKWWLWFILIVLIINVSAPINSNTTVSHNNIIIENTIEIANENKETEKTLNSNSELELPIYNSISFDEYPTFTDTCVQKALKSFKHFATGYSISPIGNSSIDIYVYANKYYDYETFFQNALAISENIYKELSTRQYKRKYFSPNAILISISICGYGKDLNSKKVNSYLQPLSTVCLSTDAFNTISNLPELIKIDKVWF